MRPLIPSPLTIDTFDGSAWIGVVPFTMWGIRPFFSPSFPGLSAFHELNVRTYVHMKGIPGVWFFSLDAGNKIAVWAGRRLFHLPYFQASMRLEQTEALIRYESHRASSPAAPASFYAVWLIGDPVPLAKPGSLEFFLTERYCLYASEGESLYRAHVHHQPWRLSSARLLQHECGVIHSAGLNQPPGDALLLYAEALKVDIWPMRIV